jgi:hypothetical protein
MKGIFEKEKVKICNKVDRNVTGAEHICICTSANWHLAAGLSYHGCSCGRSWKDEASQ